MSPSRRGILHCWNKPKRRDGDIAPYLTGLRFVLILVRLRPASRANRSAIELVHCRLSRSGSRNSTFCVLRSRTSPLRTPYLEQAWATDCMSAKFIASASLLVHWPSGFRNFRLTGSNRNRSSGADPNRGSGREKSGFTNESRDSRMLKSSNIGSAFLAMPCL